MTIVEVTTIEEAKDAITKRTLNPTDGREARLAELKAIYAKKLADYEEAITKYEAIGKPGDLAFDLASVMARADFGCQSAHVTRILELIIKQTTGEERDLRAIGESIRDVPEKPREPTIDDVEDVSYPRYTMIVPLEDKGSHDYPLNKPFLVRDLNANKRAIRGLKINGTTGNNHHGAWRYATKEEIDSFFKGVPADTILEYLNY